LSAQSDNIDKYVRSSSIKPILGYLNPSISEPILDLTFGESENAKLPSTNSVDKSGKYKIFYAGMNWNISSDPHRKNIYNLIKELDNIDIINIYGLKKNWNGYECYKGEIPFDGYSIVDKIHDSGICLVLSSQPHIEDSVCSCRLFEGLAAGVPIIADKNPFFIKWFGDNLFYINTSDTGAAVSQINTYMDYIEKNPQEVRVKLENCRNIFLERFLLDKQFLNILDKIA
jgi:hypothetical protein